MRGYMYEVNNEINVIGELTECDLYEKLGELEVKSVSAIDTAEEKLLITKMLDWLKKCGAEIVEEVNPYTEELLYGVIFTREAKKKIFEDRFNHLKNDFKNITLEDFATTSLYELRHTIEDDYGDCIYEEGNGWKTFDRWIREAEENIPYYFGNVIILD